ncbi:MAG: trypsin-like peptidase domain-containing protein [Candidatus Staskawiczbacteria bacterium]|nr:trypsin-like peptidase domain-containing protein [Candidatus Staskawiczbacteria bacterium]
MYNLPETNIPEVKEKTVKLFKNKVFWIAIVLVIVGCVIGFYISMTALQYFPAQTQAFLKYFEMPAPVVQQTNPSANNQYTSDISYEQSIINATKNVSPSVVSIVISKNVPVYEQQFTNPFGDFGGLFNIQVPQQVQKGTQYQEVGAGSGFIVSADGLVLTNKHVVADNQADYTVYTNDGKKYKAKVLALDPMQDLAVIKIEQNSPTTAGLTAGPTVFKPVTLGDSSGIQLGQTAVAIGNALGQFSNSVSVGIISGLQRTISASDQIGNVSETLEGIIQTDAAINSGNSGGPLLNLKGEVIGINTAMAQGAQSIGFAIPINMAKKDIEQVTKTNKIVYPFLGVRYVLVDEQVKQTYNLSVDYGALVIGGNNGEPAVTADSAAAKAGIKDKDIILNINGEKISVDNPMSKIIQKYNSGDKIKLHILRDGKEQDVDVTLGQKSS